MKYDLNPSDDGENIVLRIKKSDITRFFSGNGNFNIRVKEVENDSINTNNHSNPITDENLTSRELEVLKRLAKGKTNNEIAKELIVSTHTVKAHVANILQKLDVEDRVQAVVKAITEKIIDI